MATIVGAAGGGNWTANGTWVGGVAPTAADSVQLTATTGNITIDTGAVCRGADLTGYLGILTHTAGVTLTIGDATAALSNIALAFPTSGWTYTLGDVATSAISFISTSATQQTVNFGGETTGNVTFNAASNGSWQYTGAHTCGATATVTLTKGTLNINGNSCSWGLFNCPNSSTRALTLGAAAITMTGTTGANPVWSAQGTGATYSVALATITLTGANSSMNPGGASYGTVIFNGGNNLGGSTTGLTNVGTFVNLTYTGINAKTETLNVTGNMTITGTLTITSFSSTARVLFRSGALGTPRTITAAAVVLSNVVDFQDITGAGAATWTAAGTGATFLGDCGGNSGITFTTGATQTATVASGTQLWSDVTIWTSRVPLPQDNVSMASVTGGTITADMLRLGKSIDWTGATGSPVWGITFNTTSFFGSLTLISGMSFTGVQAFIAAGRSSFTITSAGQTIPTNLTIGAPGGTYTLQDAFNNGANILSLSQGTLDNSNNFTVTTGAVQSNTSNTRGLTMGTATWNLTSTGNVWLFTTTTGLTFSGASATIVLTSTSASSRTFSGGGLTYGTLTYTVAGATGTLIISGSNTFNAINFSDASNARILQFTSAITQTILTAFTVNGTAGKLMTINASTGGSAATLSMASGIVSCDYLSIQDSTATGGATFYAGANSTNVSGNTGWIFTGPPSTGGFMTTNTKFWG